MKHQRLVMGAVVALTWTVAVGAAHAGDGRKSLSILPKDTAGVFVINIDRFEKSPYYADAMAFFRNKGGAGDSIDALRDSGALDLEKDVDTVIVAIPTKSDGDAGVMVLEGRFDAAKLAKAASSGDEKFKKGKRRGVAYWARDGSAFAVIGKRFVATKSKQRLEHVIDIHKGKKKSAARSKALKRLLKHVDATKDMWIVAEKAMLKSAVPLDVDGITGSADLAKGLRVSIDLMMADKKKATDLKAQMDMALNQGQNNAMISGLLSAVTISQRGSEVVVNAAFDDAQLKLIGTLMSNMGGGTF